MLCIFSPIVLFLLGGLSDQEGGYLLPEWSVPAVGLPVLLLFVVCGVAQFILYGRQLEAYEFLEKQPSSSLTAYTAWLKSGRMITLPSTASA